MSCSTTASRPRAGYGIRVSDEGALRFAERVIALVDAGRKSATYKLATLLALIDVTAENMRPAGPPTSLSGREVAGRVIELYWPQTAVYGTDAGGSARTLKQSPQNDIPTNSRRGATPTCLVRARQSMTLDALIRTVGTVWSRR